LRQVVEEGCADGVPDRCIRRTPDALAQSFGPANADSVVFWTCEHRLSEWLSRGP